MKEFTEVILEIPDYPEKEALFSFVDGLQHWTKLEIQRRGAQDLATAISIAESLIEFKKPEKPRPREKGGMEGRGEDTRRNNEGSLWYETNKGGKGKSGGDSSQRSEGSSRGYGTNRGSKEQSSGERLPLKCFLCDGPHRARDCPKKAKLSALTEEDEEHPIEEAKVGSLKFLSAMKAKVESPKPRGGRRMFVKTNIGGTITNALIDCGASHNFLQVEEARRMKIPCNKEEGWIKAVNSKPMEIFGVARGMKVSMGQWTGHLDFFIVAMDDYPVVLGMEFMDKTKAMLVPSSNTLCIFEEDKACTIPLEREINTKGKRICAMKLVGARGVFGESKSC